jgi:hypothetical protein
LCRKFVSVWEWLEHAFELLSKCCFVFKKEVISGREACAFV